MPVHITWTDIALRLVLTFAAGALFGIDRSRHEHPAGLRTSLLVTSAASIAMLLVNVLMSTEGKTSSSFAQLDFMRLPLGILTGVGFIGAGAIIKRGEAVIGVTTAATMWFATVVGLCMGSGQLVLGSSATVFGCVVLWYLKPLERHLYRWQRGVLIVKTARGSVHEAELRGMLRAADMRVQSFGVHFVSDPEPRECFDVAVRFRPQPNEERSPPMLHELARQPGVIEVSWKPAGAPSEE